MEPIRILWTIIIGLILVLSIIGFWVYLHYSPRIEGGIVGGLINAIIQLLRPPV